MQSRTKNTLAMCCLFGDRFPEVGTGNWELESDVCEYRMYEIKE